MHRTGFRASTAVAAQDCRHAAISWTGDPLIGPATPFRVIRPIGVEGITQTAGGAGLRGQGRLEPVAEGLIYVVGPVPAVVGAPHPEISTRSR